jgi:hypothetical protein
MYTIEAVLVAPLGQPELHRRGGRRPMVSRTDTALQPGLGTYVFASGVS